MGEVFNPLLYGHPVLDHNFRVISRILYDVTSGEGIPTTRITDAAITADKIAANVITAAKIAANTITATEIAASTITAAELNVTQLSAIAANVGTLTVGTITSGVALGATWRRLYSTDITGSAVDSVTVSGLDGNSDIEYLIYARFVAAVSTEPSDFFVSPNGDEDTSHYNFQSVWSVNGTAGGSEGVSFAGLWHGLTYVAGEITQGWSRMYAKTGFDRVLVGQFTSRYTSGDMERIYQVATAWENSADNITSLVFHSSVSTCIGIGSHIEVWSRAA